jgi:hypothetical protein
MCNRVSWNIVFVGNDGSRELLAEWIPYDGAYYHTVYSHHLGTLFQRKTLRYDHNSSDTFISSGWLPRYQTAMM